MPRQGMGRHGEVAAKDLAEMGFCEKRVQLAHLHGERATPMQRMALARGQVAHHRVWAERVAGAAER